MERPRRPTSGAYRQIRRQVAVTPRPQVQSEPRRALGRALRTVAEIDELCPRWPRWPRNWPPPPTPPWEREEMAAPELFVFGMRVLAAAEVVEQEQLQKSLVGLGEKALGLSMPRG